MAIGQLVSTKLFQPEVKAEFAHGGHIGTELDGSGFVPAGDVRAHCFGGEELREPPLDVDTFYRIGIVTAPEFGEVFQRFIVATGATAGAKHHGHIGIVRFDALHNIVDAAYMVNI